MMALIKSIFAVGIHGITGQEMDEGYLEPGTLVRNLNDEKALYSGYYLFEASTDGGNTWYRQKSYEMPRMGTFKKLEGDGFVTPPVTPQE